MMVLGKDKYGNDIVDEGFWISNADEEKLNEELDLKGDEHFSETLAYNCQILRLKEN